MIDYGTIAVLLGSFFVLTLLGLEIVYSLLVSSVLTAFVMGIEIQMAFQTLVSKVGGFTILAVPFFILAGEIMSVGGISDRLIRLSNALVGWMRGGLAHVNIVTSMFFGGISGSAMADTASIGSIMIPIMEKSGYDREFATNITMASSIEGILIPPSHNMVIFAVTAGGVSIARLYLAGFIPGIFLGLMLMIYTYYISIKRNYPKGDRFSFPVLWKELKECVWAMGMIFIVVGGVLLGWMTATESAAIAVLYAIFVSFFVYKEMHVSDIIPVLRRSVKTLSTVLVLISSASVFSWFLTYLQIPQIITDLLLSISTNRVTVLLIINALLLVLGCFMNLLSIVLIMTPILLPVVSSLGMDPVHFGVMMILNLGIGLITPPVGTVLFVGSGISGVPIMRLAKTILPIFAVMIVTLLCITFIPEITTFLPDLLL